jgi:transcriptional regulator with XRE-family HTH domain
MIYALEDIARTLKEARERKGLSQRELSARSGVHQYQISKIENGTVDLRLSSLIELARALDLDLKLIPRKAMSAVNNVVRSAAPKGPAVPALKELNRMAAAVKDLHEDYPHLNELTKLHNNIQAFKHFQGIGKELEVLREIGKPVRELQKIAKEAHELAESVKLPADQLHALNEAAAKAQILRNQLAHNIPDLHSLPRPAYSLDEDENA